MRRAYSTCYIDMHDTFAQGPFFLSSFIGIWALDRKSLFHNRQSQSESNHQSPFFLVTITNCLSNKTIFGFFNTTISFRIFIAFKKTK